MCLPIYLTMITDSTQCIVLRFVWQNTLSGQPRMGYSTKASFDRGAPHLQMYLSFFASLPR